jgi:hypothetical protein
MAALVQLINYQLCNLLLSFKLKSHTLQTKSYFTPELKICAPGDLAMQNLAYTAHLFVWQHPTLYGQYENFFYLLIFRPGFKAIALHLMLHYDYFMLPLHFRN